MNKITPRTGFTLIELLVVMAIVVIGAACCLPGIHGLYSRLSLDQAAADLVCVMHYAQARAVIKGRNVRLMFAEGLPAYWLLDGTGGEFAKIPGRWGRRFCVPDGITADFSCAYIDFYPDGQMDQGDVQVCGGKMCLEVSSQEIAGRISVGPRRQREIKGGVSDEEG